MRTHKRRGSSSGGHLRSRRDTRGHAFDTVRDREAPGSNPGPPTIRQVLDARCCLRIRVAMSTELPSY